MKILPVSLFIIYSASCSPAIDCSKYKNGKYTFIPVGGKDTIYIERHDSTQLEIDSRTGKFLTSKIVWKTPCQYDLYELNASDSDKNSPVIFYKTHPIHTTIIGDGIDSYIYTANYITPNGQEVNRTNKVAFF
jgi:hypothetical protein